MTLHYVTVLNECGLHLCDQIVTGVCLTHTTAAETQGENEINNCTKVGVKLKFPCSTKPKWYTILQKAATKLISILKL